MIVVLLLGDGDVYLGYREFATLEEADTFSESLHDIMMANINGKLSLKNRLALIPEYFPWAGLVQGVEYITINQKENANG
jgi:hypothetical protein